jgi:hypothetical protein
MMKTPAPKVRDVNRRRNRLFAVGLCPLIDLTNRFGGDSVMNSSEVALVRFLFGSSSVESVGLIGTKKMISLFVVLALS